MHQAHNPEQDGFQAELMISGLDNLKINQYRDLLSHLGELGLLVSLTAENMISNLVTEKKLTDFARTIGVKKGLATRAWRALTDTDSHIATVIQDAGIKHIVNSSGKIVGVTLQSLSNASELSTLADIPGFEYQDSGTVYLVMQYIASEADRVTSSY